MQTKEMTSGENKTSESYSGLNPRVEFVVRASLHEQHAETDFVHSIMGRIFAKLEDEGNEKETGYIRDTFP
jgi:hypothetical protein